MTTSTSFPCRYNKALAELLDRVISRPGMYYQDLLSMEAMLFGFDAAFFHLDGVTRDESFSWRFNEWLRGRTGWDVSGGWSRAIAAHETNEQAARAVMLQFLAEYMEQTGLRQFLEQE